MNYQTEKLAGDPDQLLDPVPPTVVVSFDNTIQHQYHDINAEEEKEQSSSSSDSDCNEDDLFQLEAPELDIPDGRPSSDPVFVDNEIGQTEKIVSRKPPPPLKYDVPDPYRIPISVFSRNTVTASPKDWSVASNESLFSIQMGNSSFSREHGMFLMGKSDEFGNFTSGPLDYLSPRLPVSRPAMEEDSKLVDENMHVEKAKEGRKKEMKEKEKATEYPSVNSISRQSDCSSSASFGSFAFPVLANDGKNESIKVMHKQQGGYQPPPLINALDSPTALPATSFTPTQTTTSTKRRWFSCLSWCQFCS